MLPLVALACLLLLVMLRFFQRPREISVEGPMSTDANVAPGAVITGCEATFGAAFEVFSDYAVSTIHDGPTALKAGSTSSHELILSAVKSICGTEISGGAGTAEACLASRLLPNQA